MPLMGTWFKLAPAILALLLVLTLLVLSARAPLFG
jgi:hypothetical protein